MRMNGDQDERAGKLVAGIQAWGTPARPGALCAALFAAMGLTVQMCQLKAYHQKRSTWKVKEDVLG
jgi:hypothetical protein